MNSRKNKRHSAPSAAAGSAAQGQQQMVPWGPMGHQAPPMYYGWPGPMMSQPQPAPVKPWEILEKSDSSSDSECFQPSQKKRKATLPVSKKQAASAAANTPVKRGPGRPKKVQKADQDFVASLPEALLGSDKIAIQSKDECKGCRIYKGSCVLKPCGHAKYCKQCVNGLREDAVKMKRLSKCLYGDCFCLVSGWMVLLNVSG